MTVFSYRVGPRGGRWALAALLVTGLACTLNLRADDSNQGPAARLSSAEGSVKLMVQGQVAADPAPVNAPVFEGAQLATASDGKTEVQFEDGSVARVSPNSALSIVSLSGHSGAEVSLDSGLGYFEVPQGASHQLRIHFGDVVVTISAGTIVRIRLDTPPGDVAVFAGVAHLERGNALSLDLQTGQSVTLDAAAPTRYTLDAKIPPDSWDAWNDDRDQALNAAGANPSGAAADVVGDAASSPAWSELDANGSWYNIPGQGNIWSPYSASNAGWDPYGCGRWMWTPRWGYIWVSCENWGFMPYMCGQWSYYDSFGWGWSPTMGMGCGGGMWGAGYFGGVHIGRAPDRYRWVDRPGPKRPIGRIPGPILVDRRAPGGGGGGGLPPRTSPIEIGGQKIQPIGRGGLRPGTERLQDGAGNRPSPGGAGGAFRNPGSVYGSRQNPGSTGSTLRPGYTQPHPGGNLNNGMGNSNIHTSQPVQMDGNRQQPQQMQPQQQQPRSFQQQQQRDFQPQPRVNQPEPQRNYQQPQPQHNFQPAPSPQPSFHPSGGGGGAPSGGGNSGGGGVHPSGGNGGGGNNGHK